MPTLTKPQRLMYDLIKLGTSIRLNRTREYWIVGERKATGPEANVIKNLQMKKVVEWRTVYVPVVGLINPIARRQLAIKKV